MSLNLKPREIHPYSVTHVKLIETEAPDGPEGQEQPVQAVGGQGELREVTQLPSKLTSIVQGFCTQT